MLTRFTLVDVFDIAPFVSASSCGEVLLRALRVLVGLVACASTIDSRSASCRQTQIGCMLICDLALT